jgi:hypothetical protein
MKVESLVMFWSENAELSVVPSGARCSHDVLPKEGPVSTKHRQIAIVGSVGDGTHDAEVHSA